MPVRRARFFEVGETVRMTLELPGLVRRGDEEAIASIDSGFDTTLLFTLRLWEYGARRLVGARRFEVKVRRDPWTKRYVVRRETANGWLKYEYESRDAALEAATTLERVPVTRTGELERGAGGPYYFVEVLALRNPLDDDIRRASPGASGRGRGRDLEWFGALVDVLAGERARAEEVVHVRTNPFYLLP